MKRIFRFSKDRCIKDEKLFDRYKNGTLRNVKTQIGEVSISEELAKDFISNHGLFLYLLSNLYNNTAIAIDIRLFKNNEMPDINFFARAIDTFQSIHGDKYITWTDYIQQNGNIESKGDTLANMFKDILREQQGVELSQKEIEKLNEDTLERWEKF